ncbi:hypothetical protein ACHWQZ_G012009 [Mnemiopsis leidyi]
MVYNKTEFYEHYTATDNILGIAYVLCFVFGVPTNALALCFFIRERLHGVDLLKHLYILTALQDTITSLLSLNHGVTLLRYREVWLPGFCPTQHTLFRICQRMSVFLVAALSVSRTHLLVRPLRKISSKLVLTLLAVVAVLMACFFALPPLLGVTQITYFWEAGYCWDVAIPNNTLSKTWDEMDNALDTIFLAFPILPISISCLISVYKILTSRRSIAGLTKQPNEEAMRKKNNQATLTIILVTITYIVCNTPLLANYILYLIAIRTSGYPGPIYSSPLMYFYSWNVTELLTTALNASANFVLYWCRFQRFREWVRGVSRGSFTLVRTTSDMKPQGEARKQSERKVSLAAARSSNEVYV